MNKLTSWTSVPSDSDFSIYNLPFGIFSSKERQARAGMAIGDYIVDLEVVAALGIFKEIKCNPAHFSKPFLNDFIAQGKPITNAVRLIVQRHLCDVNSPLKDNTVALVKMKDAQMHMPVFVRDYTDFYSSIDHATNVGKLFRDPENALFPNWKHLPVGYHGRASSIVVSGTNIHRPKGQTKPNDGPPEYGPCKSLDFELEMAFIIGKESLLGSQISSEDAADHIFGMVLFNDWSARDIQKWEYVPLGPFLSKSFASSVSPWIVTMEALEPFKVKGPTQTPEVLPYLQYLGEHHYDIELSIELVTNELQETKLSTSNYKYMYWNMLQQLAHHTVNGCNVHVGDMMASGTISGPSSDALGSMLEMTQGGKVPLKLSNGIERRFIEDGDAVKLSGVAFKEEKRVGFGHVINTILPAI